jgi:lysine 2,3-aminomutase
LKHRITTVEQLQRLMPGLSPEEYAGAAFANHKLALAITPYFFNLIDPSDELCPIRRQVIPRVEETHFAPGEMTAPCGEDALSPVPGLVHRYPDRVLFLVTDRCAAYCRYCTRSRLVSNATGYDFHPQFEQQTSTSATTRHSGLPAQRRGPLLFSDEKREHLCARFAPIPKWRPADGTRIPVFLPQRITPQLCERLKQFHRVQQHSLVSPGSATEEADALERLAARASAGQTIGTCAMSTTTGGDENPRQCCCAAG